MLVVGAALACGGGAVGTAHSSAAACPPGSKPAVIGGKAVCLHTGQRCKTRYQATYKRKGFICVAGRLRKRVVVPPPSPPPTPTPPPTTPPPPPAQPGHYHGTDSQLETIDFDVSADGTQVVNAMTGQINEGCTPPGHLYGGGLATGHAPISASGDFTIDFTYTGKIGDFPSTGHFTLTGHFNGVAATGTLQDSVSFNANGTAYSCGSGLQTWTATRTG
jgi:hypothetical protein